MQLRDYQEEAIHWLIKRPRGLIHAPAGSGKTVMGAQAAALRAIMGRIGVPWHTHWVCNTVEQKEQAIKALQDAPFPEGTVYVECAAANPDVSKADLVVIDECHHIPAETWVRLAQSVKPGAVLWGLTATPFHEDPDRNAITLAAFKEVFTVDRARILASGHLVPGTGYMHDVDKPGEFDAAIEAETLLITKQRVRRFPLVSPGEHYRRARWQVTQEYLQKNENRNSTIASLATSAAAAGASVLLLVHSIEHGEGLVSRIPGASLVHSKLAKKTRAGLISGLREGTLSILVATSLADEGLDVPRASALVLAAGGRSAGKLEQRAGRVLRPHAEKVGGTIHDFLDRGSILAHAQARARMKVYEKLGYAPTVIRYANAGCTPEKVEAVGAKLAQAEMPELTGTWDGFR